ncbi:MAG: helix-turn-helix domain-containing protein [Pseudomonadota bacterium]
MGLARLGDVMADPFDAPLRPLFAGNLGSPNRTVFGLLMQLTVFGFKEKDIEAFLQRADLPSEAATNPNFPITLEQELHGLLLMLEELSPHRAYYTLPIRFADYISVNAFGLMGLTMLHAPTLRAAVEACLSLPQLAWGHARVTVHERADTFRISLTMDRPLLGGRARTVEALVRYCLTIDLVSIVKVIGDVMSVVGRPAHIRLPVSAVEDRPRLASEFGCPVTNEVGEAWAEYPLAVLNAPPPNADALAFEGYQQAARRACEAVGAKTSLAEQVKQLLSSASTPLARPEVAAMLGLSQRSLARKLKDEGANFGKLLADVRLERAVNLMGNPDLRIAEIAHRLGYSDAAAFSRAFQSWAGQSPSRWREEKLRL